MSGYSARQNFSQDAESALNAQINMELYASNTYFALAAHFENESSPLPGFAAYFEKQSHEEKEHAQKLRQYLVSRGGRYVAQSIECPDALQFADDDPFGARAALRAALSLEQRVNESLLALHGVADRHKDAQLCDFVESEYLDEQVKSIYEISCLMKQLDSIDKGLGVLYFDQTFMKPLT
jgi:ferritin heavy chain